MQRYGSLIYGLGLGLLVLSLVCPVAHALSLLQPAVTAPLGAGSVALQVAQATSGPRGLTTMPVQDRSGQPVGTYSASYALVIGVSKYTGGWPSLPGVKEDVRAVGEALQTQGFQVTMVL